MQGKACAIALVAALLASCADAPSRQAETPAAREKAAAAEVDKPDHARAVEVREEAPKLAGDSPARPARTAPKRSERASDDAVYVTLTTTWSEPETRTADNGGSTALPVRRSGQGEGVFAAPLTVSGLEDPTVF